jgi:putative endonuclease
VEVKTRRGTGHGFPSEAVNAQKRRRYECIAELYLESHDVADVHVSFDVVSILVQSRDRAYLRYHENAFARDC